QPAGERGRNAKIDEHHQAQLGIADIQQWSKDQVDHHEVGRRGEQHGGENLQYVPRIRVPDQTSVYPHQEKYRQGNTAIYGRIDEEVPTYNLVKVKLFGDKIR